jgi:hypothetical protein
MDGVQFHAAPFAGFEAIGVARRVSKERRHFASCPFLCIVFQCTSTRQHQGDHCGGEMFAERQRKNR